MQVGVFLTTPTITSQRYHSILFCEHGSAFGIEQQILVVRVAKFVNLEQCFVVLSAEMHDCFLKRIVIERLGISTTDLVNMAYELRVICRNFSQTVKVVDRRVLETQIDLVFQSSNIVAVGNVIQIQEPT